MPTSLTSTYLVPAVLFNPIILLHGFNTFYSHLIPRTYVASTSTRQWLENLGPAAAPGPYLDVHSNEQLCWGYTILMVLVQILAFDWVVDNRVRRKTARAAAKADRERKVAEESRRVSRPQTTSPVNGRESGLDKEFEKENHILQPATKGRLSKHLDCMVANGDLKDYDLDESITSASSEEERIV